MKLFMTVGTLKLNGMHFGHEMAKSTGEGMERYDLKSGVLECQDDKD